MNLFEDTIAAVQPVDSSLEAEVRAHLDNLTKPPGSLFFKIQKETDQ